MLAENIFGLISTSWVQTSGGSRRELGFDKSAFSPWYCEKWLRQTDCDVWESHTPGETTLSEQTLVMELHGARGGQYRGGQCGSVPCLSRQTVLPPCPMVSRPWTGGQDDAWDAVGGSNLCVLLCLVAAALHKPTSRCGWSFHGCKADIRQNFYLLACKNHPSDLSVMAQEGGNWVRRGSYPCWPPQCHPSPAP